MENLIEGCGKGENPLGFIVEKGLDTKNLYLAEESLSQKILPHVRSLVKAKKSGDEKAMKHSERAINALAGKKVIPRAFTEEEMKNPEKLAKVISCISQVKEKGDGANPFAVCREQIMGAPVEEYNAPLLKRQMKILDEYVENNKDSIGLSWNPEDLPSDVWDRLVAIKDSEDLYQRVRAYVSDRSMEYSAPKKVSPLDIRPHTKTRGWDPFPYDPEVSGKPKTIVDDDFIDPARPRPRYKETKDEESRTGTGNYIVKWPVGFLGIGLTTLLGAYSLQSAIKQDVRGALVSGGLAILAGTITRCNTNFIEEPRKA